jgi:hypothetical protein
VQAIAQRPHHRSRQHRDREPIYKHCRARLICLVADTCFKFTEKYTERESSPIA